MAENKISTHWVGCERAHPECMRVKTHRETVRYCIGQMRAVVEAEPHPTRVLLLHALKRLELEMN